MENDGEQMCANCLLTIDAVVGQIGSVWVHTATGESRCDDQAPPFNVATPRG